MPFVLKYAWPLHKLHEHGLRRILGIRGGTEIRVAEPPHGLNVTPEDALYVERIAQSRAPSSNTRMTTAQCRQRFARSFPRLYMESLSYV